MFGRNKTIKSICKEFTKDLDAIVSKSNKKVAKAQKDLVRDMDASLGAIELLENSKKVREEEMHTAQLKHMSYVMALNDNVAEAEKAISKIKGLFS